MSVKNKIIEKLASQPGGFSIQGDGAINFTDE